MWDQIWKWVTDNYVFHTIVAIAGLYIIFNPGLLRQLFRRLKKAGPLEWQADDIDPDKPCPYTKSQDKTFAAIRAVDTKVDNLIKEMAEILADVKDMAIDQQKQLFYDKDQPDMDRLIGGLKYIYRGGNHDTKNDVINFSEQHPDIYKTILRLKPELRI
jgi:hypothetical protein